MVKRTVKSLFSMLGYTVARKPKPEPDGFSVVRVGKFDIRINSKSGLKYCYEHCKDYGTQLTKLTGLLSAHLPGLQVIDIGANQGDTAALIKSGADVPVICVEGDKSLIGQFHANTAQFRDITLLETFLSDKPGELDCAYENVGHNMTLIPGGISKKAVSTRFTTIDALYAEGKINGHCKLLKIDTEGFDLRIMRGGSEFINRVQPVILFELNRENLASVESDPFSIFQWLLDRSYNTILFYESDGRFMFSSQLANHDFLRQIFYYTDGKSAKVRYLDIVVFHQNDNALAAEFIALEEAQRLRN